MNFPSILHSIVGNGSVFAHCDIPCGIYTTDTALTAARTVVTMVEKIQTTDSNDVHAITRYTNVKEQHAQICKEEICILWADFFKEEHLKDYPTLHSTLWNAVKLCSRNKREVNKELAQQLQEAVQEVSVLFQNVSHSQ